MINYHTGLMNDAVVMTLSGSPQVKMSKCVLLVTLFILPFTVGKFRFFLNFFSFLHKMCEIALIASVTHRSHQHIVVL